MATMKMTCSVAERRRVKMPLGTQAHGSTEERVEVAIRTVEPGYVPRPLSLRSSITDNIVTGTVRFGDLDLLERDPLIASVQLGQKVRVAEVEE